jgi:hypothetical protein
MHIGRLTGLLAVLGIIAALGGSCKNAQPPPPVVSSPLADSLMAVFDEMTACIKGNRLEAFLQQVDPEEARKLRKITRQHGYSSLKAYLQSQLHGWPDPDTLIITDLIDDGRYARLTLFGLGGKARRGPARGRYTFLLFRQSEDQWRLAAMTALEKDREDPYGNPITWHETDLPAKLQFPRFM